MVLVTFLPASLYERIERSIPLACVDFVPVRTIEGKTEVGLILRDSPFGRVWCHLGGRILRGESVAGALRRHAADTLGPDVALTLPDDPQPDYVYQWFPPEIAPADAPVHGDDPRKHAIGLSFAVSMSGEPSPRSEAHEFAYARLDHLPNPLWPGTRDLLTRLVRRHSS